MRVCGISTGKICLFYTFNEDDCVERLRLTLFHSRQFARLLAEEMLSYSSAMTLVALAQFISD